MSRYMEDPVIYVHRQNFDEFLDFVDWAVTATLDMTSMQHLRKAALREPFGAELPEDDLDELMGSVHAWIMDDYQAPLDRWMDDHIDDRRMIKETRKNIEEMLRALIGR